MATLLDKLALLFNRRFMAFLVCCSVSSLVVFQGANHMASQSSSWLEAFTLILVTELVFIGLPFLLIDGDSKKVKILLVIVLQTILYFLAIIPATLQTNESVRERLAAERSNNALLKQHQSKVDITPSELQAIDSQITILQNNRTTNVAILEKSDDTTDYKRNLNKINSIDRKINNLFSTRNKLSTSYQKNINASSKLTNDLVVKVEKQKSEKIWELIQLTYSSLLIAVLQLISGVIATTSNLKKSGKLSKAIVEKPSNKKADTIFVEKPSNSIVTNGGLLKPIVLTNKEKMVIKEVIKKSGINETMNSVNSSMANWLVKNYCSDSIQKKAILKLKSKNYAA